MAVVVTATNGAKTNKRAARTPVAREAATIQPRYPRGACPPSDGAGGVGVGVAVGGAVGGRDGWREKRAMACLFALGGVANAASNRSTPASVRHVRRPDPLMSSHEVINF
jgi:hypothetical protein